MMLRTRTSTMFQMSSQEPHHKIVQVPPEMLPLWKTRPKGCHNSLRLLQKAKAAKMLKLSWKPQPSIQRMLIKDLHDLHYLRADGNRRTMEDNQPRSTNHQAKSNTMEGATADTGTTEGATTDTGTKEGITTDTGTSMPSTNSLPTTSPNRQEDCYQGTKESLASNSRQIGHNTSHCYPGSYESPNEDITHGTVQQGTG